jgi:hypothetical protein
MIARQLRIVQIVCLVVAVSACLPVARLAKAKSDGEIGLIQ